MTAPLWTPSQDDLTRSEVARFRAWVGERAGGDYHDLWRWSVDDLEGFWSAVWDWFEVRGTRGDRVLEGTTMPDVRWFPGASLNFAEHLLLGGANRTAVIAVNEDGAVERLTYGELRRRVGAFQAELRALGIERADRVVALMPNTIDTLVAFIAVAGIGALWSSCSPEFGTRAVVDRFAQLEPTVLLAVESYRYGGKEYDKRSDLAELRRALPTLRHEVGSVEAEPQEPEFERLPFDHPLWVLYSSGTTGLPKGIVHGHGGILLESLKQVRIQLDVGPNDTFCWYTTTGWMMWNVVVSGLLSGGTIVLIDGSPAYPELDAVWQHVAGTRTTVAGVSAAYVQACLKSDVRPNEELDLSQVRAIASTGSPLSPEAFAWLRDHVRAGVPICSMSGGTDVCSGFLSATRLLPVYAGELQCSALGVAAAAYAPDGTPVVGEVGELVIEKPMPSMPLGLWNDDAERTRLRETYYSMFEGVWRHGDWVTFTATGSAVVHGRSDATLNRGGIRMGSSEFYRLVEALPDVADSLVVEDGPNPTTAKLLLFVVPSGAEVDVDRVKATIRSEISPRHVPDEVIQVPAIPRTLTGKKLEVPVKQLLCGVPLDQAVSVASVTNPDTLDVFVELAHSRATVSA
jgi:acetoacetyl-CoA synthetase